jgi:hypothetical protein
LLMQVDNACVWPAWQSRIKTAKQREEGQSSIVVDEWLTRQSIDDADSRLNANKMQHAKQQADIDEANRDEANRVWPTFQEGESDQGANGNSTVQK